MPIDEALEERVDVGVALVLVVEVVSVFPDIQRQQRRQTVCERRIGSGWTWLVRSGDGVDIVSTANADTPLTDGLTPLLTLDVWEHAYYLDYQNKRDTYIDTFLESLVNWHFAAENYEAAA